MESDNDSSRSNKRRSSWFAKNTRFIKKSVVAAFIIISSQMIYKDVEPFLRNENPRPQTEENVDIHNELKEMEKQIFDLRQTIDTAITTNKVKKDSAKKDVIITSFTQPKTKGKK